MLRGCVVLLAVLVGGYYLELHLLTAMQIPYAGWVAGALALGAAMLAGSLDHLGKLLLNRGKSAVHLEEGKLVRFSGRLRPCGELVLSPFTQRRVMFYEYEMVAGPGGLRGVAMTPCELVGATTSVRLSGFPDLQHFNKEMFDGKPHLPSLIEQLSKRNWKRQPILELKAVLPGSNLGLDGGADDSIAGAIESTFRNADDLARKLSKMDWSFSETVIPAGSEVTVQGIYTLNPPQIDISRGLMKVQHEIKPGSGAVVASRELSKQWIGTAVVASIAVGIHALAYSSDGKYLKQLVQWFQSLETS